MTKFTCTDGQQRVVGTWYPWPYVIERGGMKLATIPTKMGAGYMQHMWISDGCQVARFGQEQDIWRRYWCISYNEPQPPPPHVSPEEMARPILDRLRQLEESARRTRETLENGSPLFYMTQEERRRFYRGYDLLLGDFGVDFL